jgi:hypothetical protein
MALQCCRHLHTRYWRSLKLHVHFNRRFRPGRLWQWCYIVGVEDRNSRGGAS